MNRKLSKVKIRLMGDFAPGKNKFKISLPKSLNIINIEGPILPNGDSNFSKNLKAGPLLYSSNLPKFEIPGIAILANNHLFDFKLKGFNSTKKIFLKNMWKVIGAGYKKKDSVKPILLKWQNKKIGIIARCETQFGVAQLSKPGVASFDSTIYDQIIKLKKKTDIIIVSYHAATELLPWPSPQRQDRCRSLIDAGADIVYGHHSHTPQGWEKYKNGTIFYGLGNFCVDPEKWSWHPNGLWSISPEITSINKKINIKYKTTIIQNDANKIDVRESNKKEYKKHLQYFKMCNLPLKNRLLLEGLWQEASLKLYSDFYSKWLGFNLPNHTNYKYLEILLSKFYSKIKQRFQKNKKEDLTRYHLFSCESHNEVISTALGLYCGELKDLRNLKTRKLVKKLMIFPNE